MLEGKYYVHYTQMGDGAEPGDDTAYAEWLRERIAEDYPDSEIDVIVAVGENRVIDSETGEDDAPFLSWLQAEWEAWCDSTTDAESSFKELNR